MDLAEGEIKQNLNSFDSAQTFSKYKMNIFVTDPDPNVSAQVLPDKHVVKMPVETCQIIALVYSDWYRNWGPIHRADGTSYNTIKGAFRNHPCTQWAALKDSNLAWLIEHGIALCNEYSLRYSKLHGCFVTLEQCKNIFCVYDFLTLIFFKES